MTEPTRLVIVACHAIFTSGDPTREENWILAPFQKGGPDKPGEHMTFLEHMRLAIRLTEGQPAVSVVVSGGFTHPNVSSTSEARSYTSAARALGKDLEEAVDKLTAQNRLLLDEDATDSYQNLLFSLLLFKRTHGFYPDHVTIITHAFKESRFVELHAKAIRWPRSKIDVAGINPSMSASELQQTMDGEQRLGIDAWRKDLYGSGTVLANKRRQRGWKGVEHLPWFPESEAAVQALLKWNSGVNGDDVLPYPLPWA